MTLELGGKAVFIEPRTVHQTQWLAGFYDQVISPFYSVVYGFNGRRLPAFVAAIADFNSGNMLLTPKLSIFTARMTLLLNHLHRAVKQAVVQSMWVHS